MLVFIGSRWRPFFLTQFGIRRGSRRCFWTGQKILKTRKTVRARVKLHYSIQSNFGGFDFIPGLLYCGGMQRAIAAERKGLKNNIPGNTLERLHLQERRYFPELARALQIYLLESERPVLGLLAVSPYPLLTLCALFQNFLASNYMAGSPATR